MKCFFLCFLKSLIRNKILNLFVSNFFSKYTNINGTYHILYYSRIKDAIPEFIILVPPNIVRDDNEAISERNSIAILTHSCSKNLCKLDMKLTLKKFDEPNGNDEEENDEFNK